MSTDFPRDAVAALRDGQRQLDGEGVEVGVSRQAVDEVLAWIDRYIPVAVRTAEEVVVVDGINVLTVEGEPFLERVDLIRCAGRAFVPEVATLVEDAPVQSDDSFELIRDEARAGERRPPVEGLECASVVEGQWLRLHALIKPLDPKVTHVSYGDLLSGLAGVFGECLVDRLSLVAKTGGDHA